MRVACSILDRAIEAQEITIHNNTVSLRAKNTYYTVTTEGNLDINKGKLIETLNSKEIINLKALFGDYTIGSHVKHTIKYMITDTYTTVIVEGHLVEEEGEIHGYYTMGSVAYDIIMEQTDNIHIEDIKFVEVELLTCTCKLHTGVEIVETSFEGLF